HLLCILYPYTTLFRSLASSLLALLIAVPLALSVAIFLTEFSPRWLRQPMAFLVELLAAIPSVVYGTWGIFVLIPFLRQHVVPVLDRKSTRLNSSHVSI